MVSIGRFMCLQDAQVIVLANLKPRNMCAVKSNGMLLRASDAAHENVELLQAPEGSIPGERIWFSAEDEKNSSEPASPNQYFVGNGQKSEPIASQVFGYASCGHFYHSK